MPEVTELNPDLIEQLLKAARSDTQLQEVTGPEGYSRNYVNSRVPFLVTTESMLDEDPPRSIALFCNPANCTWTMGQRAAKQTIKGGVAWHMWPRMKAGHRTYWNEPSVAFALQSGNILPIVGKDKNTVPAGLGNLYDFFHLYDESPILPDGRSNWTYITYNSRIFPEITLVGRFDPEGVSFTDDSGDPNQVGWSSTFTVETSFPFFANPGDLIRSFEQAKVPTSTHAAAWETVEDKSLTSGIGSRL